jgi:hypothetical protein
MVMENIRLLLLLLLLEKRRFLYNHSGDFPQVILIIPSHVPNNTCIYGMGKREERFN